MYRTKYPDINLFKLNTVKYINKMYRINRTVGKCKNVIKRKQFTK